MLVKNILVPKEKYDHQISIHHTLPNLKAVSSRFPMDVNPLYLVVMLMIGVAEWFINYDTIFLFFGVPVIAIGATVVLAVCLSIISHQHGIDLKQWKKKFGPSVEQKDRPYGALLLASLGLVGLLVVVGWMRYEAVMSAMAVQPTANLLGSQISVTIDPEREVIISLGANVLAWLVGVFISFFVHDPDPIYAATAIDFHKSERKYERRKRQFDTVSDRLTHQCRERVEEERLRMQKLKDDLILQEAVNARRQVAQQAQGFRERAKTFLVTQGTRYKIALLEALKASPATQLLKSDAQGATSMSLTDLQGLPVGLSDDLLARLASQVTMP